jgi:pimeloyl-ACP methyl ester carboxylesterase
MTLVPAVAIFTGAAGNRLIADVFGEGTRAVLLLHGGGQTRHAWRRTAERLARAGWTAYALDQRGHGDSDWVADGAYGFADFAADAVAVADALAARSGERPAVIGASLGGIASLLAEGEAERSGRGSVFSALALVDITPRVDPEGIAKIHGFMRAHADGFASVAEAAEAVAAYLPHRPRPRSLQGLKKNLRLYPDGRWRWHWDPQFLGSPRSAFHRHGLEEKLIAAARRIEIPARLVRGGSSELVQEAHAREFLELVPHADYVDVAEARHMVAGDSNDRFSAAVLEFLGRSGKGRGPRRIRK